MTTFQAVTPFGTFKRTSQRNYVACTAREGGWHMFHCSQSASDREVAYQQRKGRKAVSVPAKPI